jgi:hypothetical protein
MTTDQSAVRDEMKWCKKPVVIEAFQMTRARRDSNEDWPEWLHRAWNLPFTEAGAVSCEDYPHSNGKDRLVIRTLEGIHTVEWNDWIIRGVKGELYPCKPDIFAATYEPASVAPAPRESVETARLIHWEPGQQGVELTYPDGYRVALPLAPPHPVETPERQGDYAGLIERLREFSSLKIVHEAATALRDLTDRLKEVEQENTRLKNGALLTRGEVMSANNEAERFRENWLAASAKIEGLTKALERASRIQPPTTETHHLQDSGYGSGWSNAVRAYQKEVKRIARSALQSKEAGNE